MTPESILLVDDDPFVRSSLEEFLGRGGYTVETAEDADSALAAMAQREFPVVVTDLVLPGGPSGLELVASVRQRHPATLCILITGHASIDTSIQALKQGVYDLLQKPFRLVEMEAVLERALDHARVLKQLAAYRGELEARIYARSLELREAQAEALEVTSWTAQAAEAPSEEAAVGPFLDRLAERWAPDGLACYGRRTAGQPMVCLSSRGPRQLPQVLEATPEDPPGLGYREEYGLPLGTAGWLYLGFADRSSFSASDPALQLLVRHLWLALRLRYGS